MYVMMFVSLILQITESMTSSKVTRIVGSKAEFEPSALTYATNCQVPVHLCNWFCQLYNQQPRFLLYTNEVYIKETAVHFHQPNRCLGKSGVYLEARMVVTAGKSVSLVQ